MARGPVNNRFNGERVKEEPRVHAGRGGAFQKRCSSKLPAWKFTPSATATGGGPACARQEEPPVISTRSSPTQPERMKAIRPFTSQERQRPLKFYLVNWLEGDEGRRGGSTATVNMADVRDLCVYAVFFSLSLSSSFASPESNKKNFGALKRLQRLCWNSSIRFPQAGRRSSRRFSLSRWSSGANGG